MLKQVVTTTSNEVRLDEVSSSKGYVMVGNKANYILAKNQDKKFIWVRVTPSKTASKPVHTYNDMASAIKDKIDNGYDVFEYESATFE